MFFLKNFINYLFLSCSLDYYCVGRLDGNYEKETQTCETYFRCLGFQIRIESCSSSLLPYYDETLKQCVANPPTGQNCQRKYFFLNS